jgi:WhiB family redox-sensing transcriptional regulator
MHRIRGVDTWVTPLMEKLDLRGEDWRDQALCAQSDPELFFPGSNGSVKPALRICHDCPVMAECRAWGDAHEIGTYGVLGGETAWQRIRRRKNAREPHTVDTDPGIGVCTSCGARLRPHSVPVAEAPGTRQAYSGHLCQSCWRRDRRAKKNA